MSQDKKSKRPVFTPFGPAQSMVDALRDNAEAFNITTHDFDKEEFRNLPRTHPNMCFVIVGMSRPSAVLLCTDVETTLYPPSTRRNLLLNIMIVEWLQNDWTVLFFPASDLEAFKVVAKRQEFRLLDPGVIPRMIKPGSVTMDSFPLKAESNVYTVENTHRDLLAKSHPKEMLDRLMRGELMLRERWANSVPLIRVGTVQDDDPLLGQNCTVCHKPFVPGAAIATVGENDTSDPRLAIEICAEHIKEAPNALPA